MFILHLLQPNKFIALINVIGCLFSIIICNKSKLLQVVIYQYNNNGGFRNYPKY